MEGMTGTELSFFKMQNLWTLMLTQLVKILSTPIQEGEKFSNKYNQQ